MTFITASTILLGLACGFGAMIYVLVGFWHWRYNNKWVGFWYHVLSLAYILGVIVIIGRFLGFFSVLPRGTTLAILAPIFGIPPGIQWFAWLRARALVRIAHMKEVPPG